MHPSEFRTERGHVFWVCPNVLEVLGKCVFRGVVRIYANPALPVHGSSDPSDTAMILLDCHRVLSLPVCTVCVRTTGAGGVTQR